MSRHIFRTLFILLASTAIATSSTNAYFTDADITSSDTFTASWHIPTARVVINEVYYLGNEEWIELYNAGDAVADIKGWTICDSDGNCGSLNPAKKTELAPGAFVLVAHDDAILKDWNVKKDIASINYAGAKIDFDDAGDAVILKNTEASIVDQMSYGTNTIAFTPSCPTVAKGYTLQRTVNGADTDLAIDFMTQQAPTLGF